MYHHHHHLKTVEAATILSHNSNTNVTSSLEDIEVSCDVLRKGPTPKSPELQQGTGERTKLPCPLLTPNTSKGSEVSREDQRVIRDIGVGERRVQNKYSNQGGPLETWTITIMPEAPTTRTSQLM